VTTTGLSLSEGGSEAPEPGRPAAPAIGAWLPTWDLITTKNLEIRKRRGLIITVAVLIVAPTVLIYGLRLLFHVADPHSYGLAGDPALFSQLTNLMAEFGFIAAAALGAAAGTTDLSDGMFRHLVVTGRSRLALYLTRIPAGLASANSAGGGPGQVLFGGQGALSIPPMPTWAMISVTASWIIGWSAIGTWRMMTRDA
jgi:hypothetical protein